MCLLKETSGGNGGGGQQGTAAPPGGARIRAADGGGAAAKESSASGSGSMMDRSKVEWFIKYCAGVHFAATRVSAPQGFLEGRQHWLG